MELKQRCCLKRAQGFEAVAHLWISSADPQGSFIAVVGFPTRRRTDRPPTHRPAADAPCRVGIGKGRLMHRASSCCCNPALGRDSRRPVNEAQVDKCRQKQAEEGLMTNAGGGQPWLERCEDGPTTS
jgi:hypothetical protein